MTAPRLALAGILTLFLCVRLPTIWLTPGGEDEDFYGTPGLTVLENGVPRLPHVPARNRDSVFYRADEALFAEPPLYFYWQAAFYAVFPKTLGAARLSSAVAGMLVVVAVFRIARWCNIGSWSALVGCLALVMSRWFFFPATRARPDILCALFGFATILLTIRWLERRLARDLCSVGIAIGLGGLCHPLAIVYAIQAAIWAAISTSGAQRIVAPVIIAAVAVLVACLWLPLIAAYPDIFNLQFHNQFLRGSGQSQLFSLWPALEYHGKALWWYIGPLQCVLCAAAVTIAVVARDETAPRVRTLAILAASGFFLIAAMVGTHHRVFGYFVYPAALTFPLIARTAERCADQFNGTRFGKRIAIGLIAVVLVAIFLPGAGLRASLLHARHGRELIYNAPAFAKDLMDQLPPDAICIVDPAYVVDFIAHGRRILLAETRPTIFSAQRQSADFLILSRETMRYNILPEFDADFLFSMGRRDDPSACYAEVYRMR